MKTAEGTYNLDTARLPRIGSTVAVRTPFQVFVGELVGVVPALSEHGPVRNRRPKLALRNDAMSAAIPEGEIREVRTLKRKRAPRRPKR
jgi:hypothetical protein